MTALVGGVLATSTPALAAAPPRVGKVLLAPTSGPVGALAVIRGPSELLSPATTFKVGTATLTRLSPARITGVARVGRVITATSGVWRPAPTKIAYQWLRTGKPIAGARGAKYTLKPTDLGKRVSVKVTATRPGYPPGISVSASVLVRAKAPPSPGVLLPPIGGGSVSGADPMSVIPQRS